MPRMPQAEWLGEHAPVQSDGKRRTMTRWDIVCVHTIVGFAPAHQAHFSTWKNGKIGQSRDTAFRSAANLDGNHRVIAIENEDAAQDVPLSDEQVEACAKILAWAHRQHGVPLQLCPDSKPGSRGLAYHRQGIDGDFSDFDFPGRVAGGEVWSESRGKTCPRDTRIRQLHLYLARAKDIVNGDDMTPEDFTKIRAMIREELEAERADAARAVWAHPLQNRLSTSTTSVVTTPAGTLLSYTHEDASRIPPKAEVPTDPKA